MGRTGEKQAVSSCKHNKKTSSSISHLGFCSMEAGRPLLNQEYRNSYVKHIITFFSYLCCHSSQCEVLAPVCICVLSKIHTIHFKIILFYNNLILLLNLQRMFPL